MPLKGYCVILESLLFSVVIFTAASENAGITVDQASDLFYPSAGQLKMTCPFVSPTNNLDDITWEWRREWDAADNWTVLSNNLQFENINASVFIRPFTGNVGGVYRCRPAGNINDTAEYFLNMLSGQSIRPLGGAHHNGTKSANLSCIQNFRPPFPLVWYAPNNSETPLSTDDKERNSNNSLKYTVGNGTNGYARSVLNIAAKLRFPAFTGTYRCQLDPREVERRLSGKTVEGDVAVDVHYNAAPDVNITKLNTRPFYLGVNISIPCSYQSDSQDDSNVTWRYTPKENDTAVYYYHHADNATYPRIAFAKNEGFERESAGRGQPFCTSTLIVMDARYSDEGVYECIVRNGHGNGSAMTGVRVISKMDAFWPFLGLAIFAVVMCTGILCYERFCSKAARHTTERQVTQPVVTKTVIHEEVTVRT